MRKILVSSGIFGLVLTFLTWPYIELNNCGAIGSLAMCYKETLRGWPLRWYSSLTVRPFDLFLDVLFWAIVALIVIKIIKHLRGVSK